MYRRVIMDLLWGNPVSLLLIASVLTTVIAAVAGKCVIASTVSRFSPISLLRPTAGIYRGRGGMGQGGQQLYVL